MAYNLYQVQMARAWTERIDKENKIAEKFWTEHAMKGTGSLESSPRRGSTSYGTGPQYAESVAASAAPTGTTSKSMFLKDRLEKLEKELQHEKEYRLKVEEELALLKTSPRPGSKPGTPGGR